MPPKRGIPKRSRAPMHPRVPLAPKLCSRDSDALGGWASKESYDEFLKIVPGAMTCSPELSIAPKPPNGPVGTVFPAPPEDEAGDRQPPMDDETAGGEAPRTDADVFLEVHRDAGKSLPEGWEQVDEVEEMTIEIDSNTVLGGRMNAPHSPGRLAVDNFVDSDEEGADDHDESDCGGEAGGADGANGGGGRYIPSMMATPTDSQEPVTWMHALAAGSETGAVIRGNFSSEEPSKSAPTGVDELLPAVEARALEEGSLWAAAESPTWGSADTLPGGCSENEGPPDENLAAAVRQAAEEVGDYERADVDQESSELPDRTEAHQMLVGDEALAADAPGGSALDLRENRDSDDATQWADPVETFALDQDFDYDHIKLTPKPDIEAMRQKWMSEHQRKTQAH